MNRGRMTDAATAIAAYLLVTSVLFVAGAFSFLGNNGGSDAWWMLAAGVLGLVAAAVVYFGPRPLPKRTLGIVTAVAIVALCLAFVTNNGFAPHLMCVQAAMFLGMHIGAYWSERSGWIWATVLLVSTVISSAASDADVPWVVFVLMALGIVGSVEMFGAFSRRMAHSASHDPLTGLLNRQGLEEQVEKLLPVFASRGLPVSMAVLDLDNFKTINDKYGHIAGDVLLNRVAKAWRGQLRRGDVLGRLGGDEFVLFMPGARQQEAAELLDALRDSHPAEWSVGLVCMPTVRRWSEIYRAADADLYRAKRARPGRGRGTLG